MQVYLDSCLVIYFVEQPETLGKPVRSALDKPRPAIEVCISDLVRMECLVGPIRESDALRQASFTDAFNEMSLLGLDTKTFDLAAQLRARHGLKTADAIHVAAAVRHGCEEFWTNDDRLTKCGAKIRFRKL